MTQGGKRRQHICCFPLLETRAHQSNDMSTLQHPMGDPPARHFQVAGEEGGTDPLPVAGGSGFLLPAESKPNFTVENFVLIELATECSYFFLFHDDEVPLSSKHLAIVEF